MNDEEFRDFLQQQQDMEDEYQTDHATVCLGKLVDILKSHGMTLGQWKAKLVAEGKVSDIATIQRWERRSSK